ncbi:MAG: U3 snoRNP protein [Trichoglossum hirsutum]|nr:MAG: U3 snoRNP protein [Trichoglossum hirsutum]
MAGGSFSSTTSTSHTLSGDTPHAPLLDLHPASKSALISALSASPQTFLQPPQSLHAAALVLAKGYLDPLAATVTEAQLQRQRDSRRKRKRGEEDEAVGDQILQLSKLYLDGFNIEQVWQQARRVLNAVAGELESQLPVVLKDEDRIQPSSASEGGAGGRRGTLEMIRSNADDFENGGSDSDPGGGEGDCASDDTAPSQDTHQRSGFSDEDGDLDHAEDLNLEALNGTESDGTDSDGEEQASEEFVEDPFGLNDGFFSIDQFNKHTEFQERQDAIGDPSFESVEDEIDWDADPALMPTSVPASKDDVRENESENEEDGPTFGDANLMDEDTDDEMDPGLAGVTEMGDNTNDIMYKDFFAPPARKTGRRDRNPNLKKSKQDDNRDGHDDGREMQRTIEAVRRDLFEDELSNGESDSGNELEALDPGDPKNRRSAHERRQARLAEEIRKLEAENVAKRQWTLSGEARANDRPLNSLLEEDLEFERTGKPIPVITAEVSESIEEMIKRRIVNQEFDEIIRRRPEALGKPSDIRRGGFELDDSKPQQSLAEIYEEEHLRRVDPDNYRDKTDEKLRKQHEEIEKLWTDISGKLDSLSSWHYKPKPAQPNVNIVADVATITLEDAQPTAAGGSTGDLGGASMLAPQEVYTSGKDTVGAGEIATRSKAPVAKSEMSREQKLRRRRREKERMRKQLVSGAATSGGMKVETAKVKAKKAVVGDLKRGGVKVIGKRGEVRDVDGKAIKERQGPRGVGGLKL